MNRLARIVFASLCITACAAAHAGLATGVNSIRHRGCAGHPGVKAPLAASVDLNAVAREWSKGGRLRDALARADYHVTNSSSMHIEGVPNETALLELLEESYCRILTDPSFTQIGIFQQQQHAWIILATPLTAPPASQLPEISRRVLVLVNDARSQPRTCGQTAVAATTPLGLAPALTRAALAHARDMAQHEFFEHEGSDGSRPADRVSRTGYSWRTVGENIALGAADAQSVVRGWLDSPGHCMNIMNPQFSDMGVAFFVDRDKGGEIYWSQVFASPK